MSLKEKTTKELRRMASGLRIEGRSKMDKMELLRNVRRAQKGGGQETNVGDSQRALQPSAPQREAMKVVAILSSRNIKRSPIYLVHGTKIVREIEKIVVDQENNTVSIRVKGESEKIMVPMSHISIYGSYVAVRSK